MKLYITILIFLSVSQVLSSRAFLRRHTQRYSIPPPKVAVSRAEVNTRYFTQRLDHFDPSNTNVWSQRYYVNAEFFNATENEVIFLMIGGEGEASVEWMTGGAWIETATRYGAPLIQLEHRFYGASHPFEDLSVENLRFLSSRQALEDTATFINGMNQGYNFTKDAKWIVFGGSYSGSLAAWLRQKFPHLVQGAMSASGPLFAQLDFPEYLQVVAKDLASYSQECVDTVKTAFIRLEELVDNPGELNITSLFNLCDDIEEVNTEADISTLFEAVSDVFAYVAQYNKNNGRPISVDDLCDILVNETYGDELQRLVEVNKLFYGSSCVDYRYQNVVDGMLDVTITVSGNMRQWYYQTCTEYGWYQSTSQEQVFGNKTHVEYYTNICKDVYGTDFNSSYISGQIGETNTHYGGYDVDVRNVVFVHGSFDPWSPMGLTNTTNPDSPVIFIEGTAHCSNMYPSSENDLPQLNTAREEVDRLIGVWLGVETSGVSSHFTTSIINILLLITSSLIISKF
ncbi:putative serine protease K12H4.7 [Anoplophora glabripennis]|uniref:putative serine protease K12H4.7 n=1 Tax=Anoplophora glabripennis TaxID=217634 RepID=UPI000873A793|nr:putative serine protease K12H4.7 [Anoplophora glabripennis]